MVRDLYFRFFLATVWCEYTPAIILSIVVKEEKSVLGGKGRGRFGT